MLPQGKEEALYNGSQADSCLPSSIILYSPRPTYCVCTVPTKLALLGQGFLFFFRVGESFSSLANLILLPFLLCKLNYLPPAFQEWMGRERVKKESSDKPPFSSPFKTKERESPFSAPFVFNVRNSVTCTCLGSACTRGGGGSRSRT